MRLPHAALGVALLLLAGPALADDAPAISRGADVTLRDRSGAERGTSANPMAVQPPGSSGTDASANAPTIGPNLLASCIVTQPGRYRIWNLGGPPPEMFGPIQAVFDDGMGSTPTIQEISSGRPTWATSAPEIPWFTGRVRVFGLAGTKVSMRCN